MPVTNIASTVISELSGAFSNLRLSEKGFYLAFVCMLVWQGVSWTTVEYILFVPVSILKLALQISFIPLICFSFIKQEKSKKETVIVCVVGLVFLISALVSEDRDLLLAFLLIAAGRDASFKRLCYIVLLFLPLLLILTVGAALFGYLDIRYAVEAAGRVPRPAWGFTHPNRLAFVVFMINMAWFGIRFPRIDAHDGVLWVPSILAIVFIIDSRTSAIALCALVAATYFYCYTYSKNGAKSAISLLILILGLVLVSVSLYFMVCFDSANPFEARLDSLVSGRLRLAHEYYSNYPPSLFGTSFEDAPIRTEGFASRLVVDNCYARLVILYGYLPAAICFASFILLGLRCFFEREVSFVLVCFGVMLIVGCVESMTISFTSNPSLIVFAGLFQGSRYHHQRVPHAQKRLM